MCAVTSAAMNTCWHSPAKEGWFCPPCHQKKVQVFGAMLAESILAVVPHRHFTFTIPKMLRPYFRFHRGLLPFPRESPLHSEFVGRPPATLESEFRSIIQASREHSKDCKSSADHRQFTLLDDAARRTRSVTPPKRADECRQRREL